MDDNIKLIDIEKMINHWIEISDKDYISMNNMFNSHDYNWALFVGHLVIEKLLKATYIKINHKQPPLIHNLLRLAELSKIELNDDDNVFFATVTTFNINARYVDYKLNFYNLL